MDEHYNNQGEQEGNTIGSPPASTLTESGQSSVPENQHQTTQDQTAQSDTPQTEPQLPPQPYQPAPASYAPANPGLSQASQKISSIKSSYSSHIIGQDEMFESIMVSLMSNGHLLIEGVPGLAKTTAAHTIASAIGSDFVRIQCTPDMLPSDIIGTQIYNQQKHEFTTQIGPINHQFVLVDEINRTSAKTQSALLEAMQERQVSIGGETFDLPKGFIVLATQNPIEQEGTYPLPEAQLDRFMFKHVISYPTIEEEIAVLKLPPTSSSPVQQSASIDDILQIQEQVRSISADDRVLSYIASITSATREPEKYGLADLKPLIEIGASPRASISLLAAARAVALMSQSGYVTPDHVKPFLIRVLRHRITLTYEAEAENIKVEDVINKIGSAVPVP